MIVYHGTDEVSARAIRTEGPDPSKSCGGYFGRAFYVAESREAVAMLAQGGDEDIETLVILEFELDTGSPAALDLDDQGDWEDWRPISHLISLPGFPRIAISHGVGAVRDINSMGGWAVYDPSLLQPREGKTK